MGAWTREDTRCISMYFFFGWGGNERRAGGSDHAFLGGMSTKMEEIEGEEYEYDKNVGKYDKKCREYNTIEYYFKKED